VTATTVKAPSSPQETAGSWTVILRKRIVGLVPPGQALPDRQPAYMQSWIYVFGMATLASLGVIILSGIALSMGGTVWWHTSSLGHYVNSVHLWSVEIFFVVLVVHLWGKFWMAAWRGKRALTWMTGMFAFLAAVGTAFTGYLTTTNFESQWISAEAKDGLNSIGIGGFFNALNPARMELWHVILLPVVIGVIVLWHIILVRRRGIVPPIGAKEPKK
jgi:quinol-cytochrome oxidoreductase complex cytochrome b subunit